MVYKLVLKDIRRVLKSYRKNKDEFRSFLDNKCSDSSAKKVIQLEHELEKAQGRIAEIDRLLNKLYEDNALGKISDDRYAQMTKTFEKEQAELKKSIPELTYEITTLKARSDAADKFTKVIDSYTDIKELNADVLNELIDRIVVHRKKLHNIRCVFRLQAAGRNHLSYAHLRGHSIYRCSDVKRLQHYPIQREV